MLALGQTKTPDYSVARLNMVEGQLRPNKITDARVLEAMETLPREIFAPPQYAGIAYSDQNLPIAPGRFALEPMIQARMIQEARIAPADRVLDVATGTGYSAAVLASMAQEIVAVESDPALQNRAVQNFTSLGIGNVDARLVPLVQGWKSKAPYDAILINGGVDEVPESLLSQLAEGGRLIAVVRRYGPARAAHAGQATLFERRHGVVSNRPLFDAHAPLLPGFAAREGFVF